ncbi:hypothetical protein PIB30_046600 [Stylosanthes scabra]|uniref:Replication factor A C-terminal domain-containing protein n=1 Tax=Stylosanthes scabra TaxID=79078 RepID=A0ABU6RGM5_9FABA|nr:hypothetical protein [Stylosanthes scabra]
MAAIMGQVVINGSVDRVADISPTKLEWNLVVVVARLYKMPNQFGGKDSYTIEMILQDEAATTCWIVAAIVSIDSGHGDWCYASCVVCCKKVLEKNSRFVCESCNKVGANPPWRYRLNVTVTDNTGCINLTLWN